MSGATPDLNQNTPAEGVNQRGQAGSRPKSLTKAEVYGFALAKLGYPVMDVEAEPQQLDIFWQRTLDAYNEYLPVWKFDVLDTASPTQYTYNLRELRKPFGRGVVDAALVLKDKFQASIPGLIGLTGFVAIGSPNPTAHLSPDHLDLGLRHISMTRRVYSSTFDWRWEEPILWLFMPSGIVGSYTVSYMYAASADKAEDIPEVHRRLVKDHFYNTLKYTVGETRAKFGGVPGPAGQQMDGATMKREAEEQIAKLEEDMKQRGRAWVPPLGPGAMSDR